MKEYNLANRDMYSCGGNGVITWETLKCGDEIESKINPHKLNKVILGVCGDVVAVLEDSVVWYEKNELEHKYNIVQYNFDMNDIELQECHEKNWFERLPLSLRFLYYMTSGFISGYICAKFL